MKKSGTVYTVIFIVWGVCLAGLAFVTVRLCLSLDYTLLRSYFIAVLFSVNSAVLGVMWLGSIKDFVFSLTYALCKKKFRLRYEQAICAELPSPEEAPRFLLLYCTCNDFNERALAISIRQNYPNFKTVILDDSGKDEYKERVDTFAEKYGVEVVRREDRTGFKAGNLNNYLRGRTDYEYFVILDSDEIIPPGYIMQALRYFRSNERFGAVQARHSATAGANVFQRLMGMGVRSNGSTVQVVKNFYGANALIGHGMAVSRACYEKTGGFPLVVAEDISFAVDIKNAGFEIVYAPDIHCYEEFPTDYASLKKRQCKWVQGNLEYIKKYNRDIGRSKMRWFEKADLKLSHYPLPLMPLLSLLLVLCTLALGFLGFPVVRYSLFVYGLMILFLCSPLIPDLFVYSTDRNNVLLILPAFLLNVATYASFAPMLLRTVICGLFGKKATFTVTPKQSRKFTFRQIVRYSAAPVLFALVLFALSLFACRSVVPVLLLGGGCLLTPLILVLCNVAAKRQTAANSRKVKDGTRAESER